MRRLFNDPGDGMCECGHRRRSHGSDSPWARCGTSSCLLDTCPCGGFAAVIMTSLGTPIRRFRPTGVGKRVGDHLYLHRRHAGDVLRAIPMLRTPFAFAVKAFHGARTEWDYNCVRIDVRHIDDFRFDEAPDFDDAREPHVGRFVGVRELLSKELSPVAVTRTGHSDAIWHHKWLFVKDDYPGFDVAESRRWSARYSPLIAGAPSGSARVFRAQLMAAGIS